MAGWNDERKLYEQLKKAYQDLEIDDTADEKAIKKKYRVLAKKYHPDVNPGDKYAEERFKAISFGYELLIDEKNRRVYLKLKEKYDTEKAFTKKTQKSSERKSEKKNYTHKDERANNYIFNRRDGSRVEIVPISRVDIEGQTIYNYKILQYYKDRTITNNLCGRINLNELFKSPDYCDFCVNTFLSKENIEKTILQYGGFLGYIEVANSRGRKLYRTVDRERAEIYDLVMDIGRLTPKSNYLNIEKETINVLIEKCGKMIVNGKSVEQYVYFSEYLDVMDLIYSEEIDFNKAKKNARYRRALERLLVEERVDKKIKEGGYIGSLAYDPETDEYNIVVDNELVKAINVKQTEGR